LDLLGPDGFREACRPEREQVLERLLALLEAHRISATWCVLGHLFLARCGPWPGPKHPEIARPRHAWVRGDWFAHDPGTDEARAPLYYARSLVARIRDCPVPQEIGGHSFSHVIFGDAGCSRETARTELAASLAAAGELGLTLRSFAFPRNSVGHLPELAAHGFTCFRGPGPRWYERDDAPGLLGRLAHLWDVVRAATPPTVLPERTPEGLVNVPGSMIYFPMHGVRRLVPVSRRVRRALRGVDAAVRERRVFHLWFHPTNLADGQEPLFAGLAAILRRVSELRDAGRLDVLSMGELACGEAARPPRRSPSRRLDAARPSRGVS
jgi:hypothetical protein